MALIASSLGNTPDSAKKQTCMMVLMRPPMPLSRATLVALITKNFAFFASKLSWTGVGSLGQISVGEQGVFSRNVPPGTKLRSMSKRSRNAGWWQAMKLAFVIRYVERIGCGPKRRCETVIEPDFLES